MDKKIIGSLVKNERKRRGYTIQQLAKGIISPTALQRLENGERLPDYFVLERIIGRLGRSINKIEFMLKEDTYEVCYLRELIEGYLQKQEYKEVMDALEYYKSLSQGKEALHRQYIKKMTGLVLSEQKGDHEEAARFFQAALEETVCHFELERIHEFLLVKKNSFWLFYGYRNKYS